MIEDIDHRIITLANNDPVVNYTVNFALQNDMSENEFLILLVESLIKIKNTLNNELINMRMNGPAPIIIENNTM